MKTIFTTTKLFALSFFFSLFSFSIAYAQQSLTNSLPNTVEIGSYIRSFNANIVTAVSTLFMALAMTAFFWGLAQYIWAIREGDATKIQKGNQFMLWSVIAIFVMVSIWGIVLFGQTVFQFTGKTDIKLPSFLIQGGSASPGSSGNPGGGAGQDIVPNGSGSPCSAVGQVRVNGNCVNQGDDATPVPNGSGSPCSVSGQERVNGNCVFKEIDKAECVGKADGASCSIGSCFQFSCLSAQDFIRAQERSNPYVPTSDQRINNIVCGAGYIMGRSGSCIKM